METLGRCSVFVYVCMRVGMHACVCVCLLVYICVSGWVLDSTSLGTSRAPHLHLRPPHRCIGGSRCLGLRAWVCTGSLLAPLALSGPFQGVGEPLDLRSLGPGSVCFVIAVGACGLVVVRSSFWFLKKIRCLANISMQVRVCSGSTSVKMWPGPAGELWLLTPADECHFRSGSSSLWH